MEANSSETSVGSLLLLSDGTEINPFKAIPDSDTSDSCTHGYCIHRVPKKLSRFVFVRTSSNFQNFDNFWQKDGKRSKYMRGALTFHLT